jgi:hypothetical protein
MNLYLDASNMPVDLSKPHSDRRRDASAGVRQDGMHSREIEMKRNRGEISCAECRRCVRSAALSTPSVFIISSRLKIKCDKKIPCQSCQVSTLTLLITLTLFLICVIEERMCISLSQRSVFSSIHFSPMLNLSSIHRQSCHRSRNSVRPLGHAQLLSTLDQSSSL